MAELRRIGARSIPVVSRGDAFVFGQVLDDVAAFVGVELDHRMLPADELVERLETILAAAGRFAAQIPDTAVDTLLPNRPRTYLELANHVFVVADGFLDAAAGGELTYERLTTPPTDDMKTGADVARFGADVQRRLAAWWDGLEDRSGEARLATYYGSRTMAAVLERTTWHSGQHVRQLMMVLDGLGIEPDGRLTDADFAGLPMPERVWDE